MKQLIGGQAVIEGVMMRTPRALAVAVRKPGGDMVLHRSGLRPVAAGIPLLRRPFIRGVPTLFSALVVGMKALNFSVAQALEEESDEGGGWAMLLSSCLGLGGGLLLFFYLPLLMARGMHLAFPGLGEGLLFNTVDGIFRIAIFVLYIFLISRWGEIRRVFAYHGAEHMTVSAYEAGKDLRVDEIRRYSTVHPRCGTSFLLVVMLIGILLFSLIPSGWPIWAKFVSRVVLLPVLAGISYEVVKAGGKTGAAGLAGAVGAPGRWLQRMTALPPDDDQIEIAVVALEAVLEMERSKAGA